MSCFRCSFGDDAPPGTVAYALILVQLNDVSTKLCTNRQPLFLLRLVNFVKKVMLGSDSVLLIAHRVHHGISDTQYL